MFLIVDAQAKQLGTRSPRQLGVLVVQPWHEVVQHVPVELAERARAAATDAPVDAVVCLGGGSSTGLAKALALSHDVPIVAVPTTYAGSEQTPIYGLTGGRHKQTGKDLEVLPKVVVYDPELTVGLPPQVTGPSAFNALAHCVEALYAPGCNPVTSALALEGVRAIHALAAHGDGRAGRPRRSRRRCSTARTSPASRSARRHRAAPQALPRPRRHVQPRARRHALGDPAARGRVQRPGAARRDGAPGRSARRPGGDPAGALWDLAVASHVPTRLADLGLSPDDLPEAASPVRPRSP